MILACSLQPFVLIRNGLRITCHSAAAYCGIGDGDSERHIVVYLGTKGILPPYLTYCSFSAYRYPSGSMCTAPIKDKEGQCIRPDKYLPLLQGAHMDSFARSSATSPEGAAKKHSSSI